MKHHAALATAIGLLAWRPTGAVAAGCSSSTGFIISSPRDADAISDCSTLDGSVSVQFGDNPSAWSSDAGVDLGQVSAIRGNLTIYPSARHKTTKVAAAQLAKIQGGITVWNNDISGSVESVSISFPKLGAVEGDYAVTGDMGEIAIEQAQGVVAGEQFRVFSTSLQRFALPGLTSVKGEAGADSNGNLEELDLSDVTSIGSSLRIQTNGKLSTVKLDKLEKVGGDLRFYQNGALRSVRLPKLGSADTISFTSNGPDPAVSMPKLESLGSASTTESSTFEDVKHVNLPQLRRINGGIAFQSTKLVHLTVPAVKSLNGTFSAKNNGAMESLALPRLETIRDVFIEANPLLANVTANALTRAGTVSIKGQGLVNVELFALKEVTGDFKVAGAEAMDCTWFEDNVKPIVKGIFSCVGSHEKPSKERGPSTGGIEKIPVDPNDEGTEWDDSSLDGNTGGDDNKNGGSKNEGGSGGGLSTGAKAGIAVGVILVVAVAAVAVFFFLRRKKQQRQAHRLDDIPPSPTVDQRYSRSGTAMSTTRYSRSGTAMSMRSPPPSTSTGPDGDASSADVYDGVAGMKMGVETKIEAMGTDRGEKRRSLMDNLRLSTGLGKPLRLPDV